MLAVRHSPCFTSTFQNIWLYSKKHKIIKVVSRKRRVLFCWFYYLVATLCLTSCDPMDCSPPGSFVHGISQARMLERVAISFSRVSSRPRDGTCISCLSRRILYHGAIRKAQRTIDVWVDFWALCSVPLVPVFMPVPPCFGSIASQCSLKSGSKVDSSCVLS